MNRAGSLKNGVLVLISICLALLACRVTDVIVAQGNQTPTSNATRPRPTFTLYAQVIPPTATIPPPPTLPPSPSPRRPPTLRPPTHTPTLKPPTLAPPTPTRDPQGAFYYKYRIGPCVAGENTRIQGTITNNGTPVNGITVRVTADPDGPAIVQIITGSDPSDPNHLDPSLIGKYRLGIAEGTRMPGNWWVFIVNANGDAESAKAFVHTDEWAGCNTATIDWVH